MSGGLMSGGLLSVHRPQQFLTPEIRKLAKNLVYFDLIVGICWGNCTKLSYLMCCYRGIKCHLILGSFFPKILGPKT